MTTAPALTFDAERHAYSLAGRSVPSVTQVIRAVLPGWEAAPWYLQRGRALHHGAALLDEGRLDWLSVAPEIEARLQAWARFCKEADVTILTIEKQLASERYQFAGTTDRVLMHGGLVLVGDLKSTIEPQVIPQLGGYSLLWREAGQKIDGAVAVELRDDATYRTRWLDRHELRRAEQTFMALLGVYNFAQANGVKLHGR